MNWWQTILTVAGSVLASTGFWNWLSSRERKKSDETRLLLGIAYSKIIQTAEEHIRRGYIGAEEYKELYHYLYEPYKSMGGDGTAERLIKQVGALPSEPTGKENKR